VSLADTSRTATAPYVLDKTAGYICNSDSETNLRRRDRVVPLPVDMPTTYNSLTLKQQYAADKLFDEALEWLGQHDTIADFYTITVAGLTTLFALGQTIHVTTTTTVNGEAAYVIDDDFNVMSAGWSFDDAGELIAVMEISTIEREAASDAQVLAGAVVSAARNAGGATGASVSTVVTQVSGIASIVGGTADGMVVGGSFPEAGTFTDVTITGVLALPVKPAHTALMGPVSGSDANPDFRGIIALDLPGTITADHIGERTGGHGVVIDNTLILPASTIVPNGGTIGQVAGPLMTFDDTLNQLRITGCQVAIGLATAAHVLDVGPSNFPIGLYGGTDGSLQGEIAASGSVATRTVGFNLLGTSTAAGDNWVIYRFNGANNKIFMGDSGAISYINSGNLHPLYLGAGKQSTMPARPTLALLVSNNVVAAGNFSAYSITGDGTNLTGVAQQANTPRFTISNHAPINPSVGDMWLSI
jgi:hypothetical protein